MGKSDLAVALGIKAIEAGYRVLFTTAAALIASLTNAHAEGRLDEKLKVYTAPRLLIIDEFVVALDAYIRWYNEARIKISPGARSPAEHCRHLGIAA